MGVILDTAGPRQARETLGLQDLTQLGGKHPDGEGFLQDCITSLEESVGFSVSGDKDYFHVRPGTAEGIRQLWSREFRHEDVSDENIDLARILVRQSQGFFAAGGG